MEVSAVRRRTMQAVKSKDTSIELIIRRLLHRQGYRYRLHRKDLPGRPDLVFSSRRKVVFVHGCFWHGHDCPRGSRVPVQNRNYWMKKIARNKERDRAAERSLMEREWRVCVLWECEIKQRDRINRELRGFLNKA